MKIANKAPVLAKKAMKAMKTVGTEAKGTVLAKKAMKAAAPPMKAMKIVGAEAKGTVLAKKAMKAAAPPHEGHEVSCLRHGSPIRGPAPVCGCLHTRRA